MNAAQCLRSLPFHFLVTFAVGAVCVGVLAAEAPEAVKPSSYAAAKDLAAQIDDYVGEIETALETEQDYSDEARQRVAKDAATVAALALVVGMHDEQHARKKSAAAVIAAARKLGAGAKDYAASKQNLAELKQALAAGEGEGELEWKAVADVGQLMKQVPIVNNNLRRNIEGRRFERAADKNLGYAATLAAIAQAASFDTTYCADEADETKWRELSVALRDSTAEVAKQVRASDQQAAVKALGAVEKSCTDCHTAFGIE